MAFQNTVGKGENASNNFLHASQCFFLPFQALSSMLFANIFKLKESKMLSFGKEISSKYSKCRIFLSTEYIIKCLTPLKNINKCNPVKKNGINDTVNDMQV